jgi:hypothetical protein
MDQPVKHVFVTVTPDNDQLIEWKLDPAYILRTPSPSFYVEVARASGEWKRLNPDNPIIDSCIYVDTTRYRFNLSNDVFYRIVVDDAGSIFNSKPEATLGVLTRADFLIMRDVIRKEYLRLKKYVGAFGFLLKHRDHGTPCPKCLDHDLQTVVNSNCLLCFGTNKLKGYYNGFPYWVDLSGTTSQKDVNSPLSVTDNKARTVRSVAYPRMDTYDIWVDGDKNKRYVIRQVQTAVEIRGKPLVYVSQFREIPTTSIEYRIPLEQPLTAEEEAAGLQLQGWRKGIGPAVI